MKVMSACLSSGCCEELSCYSSSGHTRLIRCLTLKGRVRGVRSDHVLFPSARPGCIDFLTQKMGPWYASMH